MRVLVTGGAGYIGSFVSRLLEKEGHQVTAIDNLTYGHREAAPNNLEIGDISDAGFLDQVLERCRPEAVMHLAAFIEAGESVHEPAKYFVNNTAASARLLGAMTKRGIRNLVFSSTAAVYGTPEKLPLTETSRTVPESPYGLSKLLTEMSLPAYAAAYGLRYIALRYFNAAGAALDGSRGQDHEPATHLITSCIKAALGQRSFTVNGTDYDTPDGTCVRDYIHVLDIARAHVQALGHLAGDGQNGIYNVGTGAGHSNLEVIDMVKSVSGEDFPVTIGERRAGDPSRYYANARLIQRELGWEPAHSDLETIVSSAWKWHSSHPDGYATQPGSRPSA